MELNLQPKQTKAFETEATELLYGGAASGGKSHLIRVAAIAWCAMIPGLNIYLFRRTSPELQKNHMVGPTSFPAMLAEWISKGHVKINEQKGIIKYWNDSKIFLCHAQHEKDVYSYAGPDFHVLIIDELTTFTEDMYKFLRSRVRLGSFKVPAKYKDYFPRIVTSSNPGNIGHNWVKQSFVTIAKESEIIQMPETEGGLKRQFIRAKLEDNQEALRNDPGYGARLLSIGDPALAKAMREGDWNIVAGGMFDDVWDNDFHILAPFKIPESWTIDRSFDWGSSKPFSVGWWAESDGTNVKLADGTNWTFPPRTLFRINEWYGWNKKANTGLKMTAKAIAKGIKEIEEKMNIANRVIAGPADSSIFNTENGNCIATDMKNAGVKWKKANKSPGTRISGWQLIRDRLVAAKSFPMEAPGLFVFNNCVDGFIRTIPVLPRDKSKPDDVDTNSEDHTGDEVRYRCLHKVTKAELGRMKM